MAKIKYVYWKDEIGGKTDELVTTAFSYGYTVGPHGEWEMVIAKEDKEVKKDETVNIMVEKIEVPPKSIVLLCPTLRHALGVVLSTAAVGEPLRIEERRTIGEVIFLPVSDGKVSKGDLLTVLNIFYAALERRLARGAAEKWLMERYRY